MSPDAAESLLDSGVQHVVVKRGPDGATAFTTAGATEALGFVIDPLDTVGAGDAFVAGYLSAHLEGLDVADTLVRANACGAMACLVPGDWEAAPTRRDLERFLAGGAGSGAALTWAPATSRRSRPPRDGARLVRVISRGSRALDDEPRMPRPGLRPQRQQRAEVGAHARGDDAAGGHGIRPLLLTRRDGDPGCGIGLDHVGRSAARVPGALDHLHRAEGRHAHLDRVAGAFSTSSCSR